MGEFCKKDGNFHHTAPTVAPRARWPDSNRYRACRRPIWLAGWLGLLDWWCGGLVGLLIGGLVDWWIGGLVEWKLAAWGSEALQVTSSTRDRDGSADHVSWRLWEAHLYVFYVSGRLQGAPGSNQAMTPGGSPS